MNRPRDRQTGRARRIIRAAMVAGWIAAGGGPTPVEAQPPSTSPVRSASQHFIVSGMTKGENVAMVADLDNVAARVEQLVGMRLPFDLGPVLRLVVQRDSSRQRGRAIKAQGWVDGMLEQKLIVVNIDRFHQEDLLEALCWLLFNRYAIREQSARQRETKLAESPEWLTVGLAQNLFASLRVRNSRLALDEWQRQTDLPPSAVMERVYMPEGRWKEKAYAGLVVEWLTGSDKDFWRSCVRRIAQNEPLDPGWALERLRVPGGREAEMKWDLWLAGRTQTLREWGVVTPDLLSEFDDLLRVRPARLGVAMEADLPPEMTLRELLPHRDRAWMRPLVDRMMLQIKSAGIGQPKEFRDVIDRYADYLARLPKEKKGWGARSTSNKTLTGLLEQAETARMELEQTVLARERFGSLVETEWAMGSAFRIDNEADDGDKVRRYLNEIEQQREKESLHD